MNNTSLLQLTYYVIYNTYRSYVHEITNNIHEITKNEQSKVHREQYRQYILRYVIFTVAFELMLLKHRLRFIAQGIGSRNPFARNLCYKPSGHLAWNMHRLQALTQLNPVDRTSMIAYYKPKFRFSKCQCLHTLIRGVDRNEGYHQRF